MGELKFFALLSWISLPAVFFGGYSALTWLHGKLSDHQMKFFRLGHAHAGVLLILSLCYYPYLLQTRFSHQGKLWACVALAVGIILQSGGFFWHAFLDKTGQRNGMYITSLGAALLMLSVLTLAAGLFVAL